MLTLVFYSRDGIRGLPQKDAYQISDFISLTSEWWRGDGKRKLWLSPCGIIQLRRVPWDSVQSIILGITLLL